MQDIVTYSMGICSAYIAARLKETCHEPLCVFSDTKREHADTYRFGREVAAKWGLSVVEASDGRDLWDVFREWNMIPARQLAACSIAMKIKPFQKWLTEFIAAGGTGRVAYGYDSSEQDRAERTVARWPFPEVTPWFPLLEWGVRKDQCFTFFRDAGVTPPAVYATHRNANCIPCKNFRLPDWIATRYHYPEEFAAAMALEEEMGQTWMQDGTALRAVPDVKPKVRRLAMAAPAFNFESGCDACAVD